MYTALKECSSKLVLSVVVVGGLLSFMQVAHAEAPFTAAEVVIEVNKERIQDGLSALTVAPLLEVAAGLKGKNMAEGLYFAHQTPEGYTPWHFFTLVGYEYVYAGENLAIDYFEPQDVVEAMMQSPGHRDNILGAQYAEIAVAVVPTMYGGHQRYMVVMLFGTHL